MASRAGRRKKDASSIQATILDRIRLAVTGIAQLRIEWPSQGMENMNNNPHAVTRRSACFGPLSTSKHMKWIWEAPTRSYKPTTRLSKPRGPTNKSLAVDCSILFPNQTPLQQKSLIVHVIPSQKDPRVNFTGDVVSAIL